MIPKTEGAGKKPARADLAWLVFSKLTRIHEVKHRWNFRVFFLNLMHETFPQLYSNVFSSFTNVYGREVCSLCYGMPGTYFKKGFHFSIDPYTF